MRSDMEPKGVLTIQDARNLLVHLPAYSQQLDGDLGCGLPVFVVVSVPMNVGVDTQRDL